MLQPRGERSIGRRDVAQIQRCRKALVGRALQEAELVQGQAGVRLVERIGRDDEPAGERRGEPLDRPHDAGAADRVAEVAAVHDRLLVIFVAGPCEPGARKGHLLRRGGESGVRARLAARVVAGASLEFREPQLGGRGTGVGGDRNGLGLRGSGVFSEEIQRHRPPRVGTGVSRLADRLVVLRQSRQRHRSRHERALAAADVGTREIGVASRQVSEGCRGRIGQEWIRD